MEAPSQKVIDMLSESLGKKLDKKPRTLLELYKFRGDLFMLCNDHTLWVRSGGEWQIIGKEALPPIPQVAV